MLRAGSILRNIRRLSGDGRKNLPQLDERAIKNKKRKQFIKKQRQRMAKKLKPTVEKAEKVSYNFSYACTSERTEPLADERSIHQRYQVVAGTVVDISSNQEWILVETDTLSPCNDYADMSASCFREVFSFVTLKP